MNRRDVLRWMGNGFGMVGLANVLHGSTPQGPLAPKTPHFPPQAKRVIFLFLNGGMSQVDTFDPKPMLDQARWRADAGAEDQDGPRIGQSDALAVRVSEVRAERARSQRDLSQSCGADRRLLRDPIHVLGQRQSRPSLADDELRAQAARPAVDGIVAHLRIGDGEPESARFHGAVPGHIRCSGP